MPTSQPASETVDWILRIVGVLGISGLAGSLIQRRWRKGKVVVSASIQAINGRQWIVIRLRRQGLPVTVTDLAVEAGSQSRSVNENISEGLDTRQPPFPMGEGEEKTCKILFLSLLDVLTKNGFGDPPYAIRFIATLADGRTFKSAAITLKETSPVNL